MKYKITIEEITPYAKLETVYLTTDGKVYSSTYRIPDGEKYTEKQQPTGENGYSERQIYEQTIETNYENLVQDIIKASNQLELI